MPYHTQMVQVLQPVQAKPTPVDQMFCKVPYSSHGGHSRGGHLHKVNAITQTRACLTLETVIQLIKARWKLELGHGRATVWDREAGNQRPQWYQPACVNVTYGGAWWYVSMIISIDSTRFIKSYNFTGGTVHLYLLVTFLFYVILSGKHVFIYIILKTFYCSFWNERNIILRGLSCACVLGIFI